MKTISIFLALINSLLAGLLISFLVTSAEARTSAVWWTGFRILLALAIILIGLLAWAALIVPIPPSLLVLSSLFLVAAGPATVVWTFHRASLMGQAEYPMLLYGASLFSQGIALLFGFLDASHDQRLPGPG